MKKHDFILAIDPDCEKSGVALLGTQQKLVLADTMTFPKLIDHITNLSKDFESGQKSFVVVVEAGWLISTNWHLNYRDSHRVASAKGLSIGRNQETGKKIIEMCEHLGVEVKEIRPLKKFWKGPDNKITHDEIVQFIPGLPNRTNQEIRDAALLAWYFAGFAVRVAPSKS